MAPMPLRSEEYDARLARLEAQGRYLHGEADLVDWLLRSVDARPDAAILDAGCGTGRVAVELTRRGHRVVGVDSDPVMLEAARVKAPDLRFILADLAHPALVTAAAEPRGFDLIVAAGNVMIFLEHGTEPAVVSNLAHLLRPGGLLVAGFQLGARLGAERYDVLCADAKLVPVYRWATWERDPYRGGDYAVSVHRLDDVHRLAHLDRLDHIDGLDHTRDRQEPRGGSS
jgi:SAM-dependent methyltransferase